MLTKYLPVVVLACTLFACGGSSSSSSDTALCSELQSALDGFGTKAAPCGVQFTSPVTGATCSSHLPGCTDADKTALRSFASCMNGVPACSTATAQTWGTQVQGCLNGLQQVSKACAGQ